MPLTVTIHKPTAATTLGLIVTSESGKLPKVAELRPGSLSESSNLQVGDQIMSINGAKFESANAATDALKAASGDVAIVVQRPGYNFGDLACCTSPRKGGVPSGALGAANTTLDGGSNDSGGVSFFSALPTLPFLKRLTSTEERKTAWMREEHKLTFDKAKGDVGISLADDMDGKGCVVSNVTYSGLAARAGLHKGDVVVRVNGNAVTDHQLAVSLIDGSPRVDLIVLARSRASSDYLRGIIVC